MGGVDPQPTDAEIAIVIALADGSLPEPRRAEAERIVAGSPMLTAQLAVQRRAVERLRAVDVAAPARLRARIEVERRRRRSPLPAWPFAGRRARSPRRLGTALAGAVAAGLALATLVTILVLPSDGGGAPTVAEAAALAQRGPSTAAPARARAERNLLAASTDGVAFPNLRAAFDWSASGMRADRLGDRAARTVFYARQGRRVAYTIVSGAPLEIPERARLIRLEGTRFRVMRQGRAVIAIWTRQRHTCLLTGAGMPLEKLLELAAWKGGGAVSF